MISAVQWLRRGVARREPVQYELTPEELEALQASVKAEADYHGVATGEDEEDEEEEEEDEDDDEDGVSGAAMEDAEWEDDEDDEDKDEAAMDADDDDHAERYETRTWTEALIAAAT